MTEGERAAAEAAWDAATRAELGWRWAVTLHRLGLGELPPHPPRNPYKAGDSGTMGPTDTEGDHRG